MYGLFSLTNKKVENIIKYLKFFNKTIYKLCFLWYDRSGNVYTEKIIKGISYGKEKI